MMTSSAHRKEKKIPTFMQKKNYFTTTTNAINETATSLGRVIKVKFYSFCRTSREVEDNFQAIRECTIFMDHVC